MAVVVRADLPYFPCTKEVRMKLTIDLPVDVVEVLGTLAIREHRYTPQQAAYLLTRWAREGSQDRRGSVEPAEQVRREEVEK